MICVLLTDGPRCYMFTITLLLLHTSSFPSCNFPTVYTSPPSLYCSILLIFDSSTRPSLRSFLTAPFYSSTLPSIYLPISLPFLLSTLVLRLPTLPSFYTIISFHHLLGSEELMSYNRTITSKCQVYEVVVELLGLVVVLTHRTVAVGVTVILTCQQQEHRILKTTTTYQRLQNDLKMGYIKCNVNSKSIDRHKHA